MDTGHLADMDNTDGFWCVWTNSNNEKVLVNLVIEKAKYCLCWGMY